MLLDYIKSKSHLAEEEEEEEEENQQTDENESIAALRKNVPTHAIVYDHHDHGHISESSTEADVLLDGSAVAWDSAGVYIETDTAEVPPPSALTTSYNDVKGRGTEEEETQYGFDNVPLEIQSDTPTRPGGNGIAQDREQSNALLASTTTHRTPEPSSVGATPGRIASPDYPRLCGEIVWIDCIFLSFFFPFFLLSSYLSFFIGADEDKEAEPISALPPSALRSSNRHGRLMRCAHVH